MQYAYKRLTHHIIDRHKENVGRQILCEEPFPLAKNHLDKYTHFFSEIDDSTDSQFWEMAACLRSFSASAHMIKMKNSAKLEEPDELNPASDLVTKQPALLDLSERWESAQTSLLSKSNHYV